MSKKEKMQSAELEKVSGGYGGYSPSDWDKLCKIAAERGTCEKCGKKFSEAQHAKISLPPIMNAEAQKYYEINWCGDCIDNYWEQYGKGLDRSIFGKPLESK